MIKCRYRSFGLHVTVHFKTQEWLDSKMTRYVPARLYFTEDVDLVEDRTNPEWFAEVNEQEEDGPN